jgi:hypothetical protein
MCSRCISIVFHNLINSLQPLQDLLMVFLLMIGIIFHYDDKLVFHFAPPRAVNPGERALQTGTIFNLQKTGFFWLRREQYLLYLLRDLDHCHLGQVLEVGYGLWGSQLGPSDSGRRLR